MARKAGTISGKIHPSEEEAKKAIKRWKRFRSYCGFTQPDIANTLKYERCVISSFETCNYAGCNWFEMKKKLEEFMKDVKEQLELKEGEELSDMKARARKLLEDKMILFDRIKAIKEEIKLDDENIGKLECDVGVNVIEPSTTESAPHVKEEPLSQPSEDACLQVHQRAAFKYANYEWLKKHLKDRTRQRHFVYIVIHPVTKKIVYVGASNDVWTRMEDHRRNKDSAIYGFLKQFPNITARIIFTGSYYSCKAVESMIINMQGELRLDLSNVSKETEAVTPRNKNYAQIEEEIETVIAGFPIKCDEPNHDRLLNAVKYMLDRSEDNGEVVPNMTKELWNHISGAQLHYDKREDDGIDAYIRCTITLRQKGRRWNR